MANEAVIPSGEPQADWRNASTPAGLPDRSSSFGTAISVSLLLHLAVLLAFGAMPGAQFARPWMQGSGTALTVVSLSHAPATQANDAIPGVLPGNSAVLLPLEAGSSTSGTTPDIGPALDASGRNGPRDASPLALLPQAHYFPTNELDTRPGIMVHIQPEYPAGALAEGITGSAVIRIYINESGTVDDVVAISGKPPGVFEESAVAAFRMARFSPGAKGGIPVKAYATLEVQYELPHAEFRPR